MRNRTISLDGEPLHIVKAQLRLLIMSERISPTKYGWKDIRYLRQKIARMERAR